MGIFQEQRKDLRVDCAHQDELLRTISYRFE